jgi:hypothetical protein
LDTREKTYNYTLIQTILNNPDNKFDFSSNSPRNIGTVGMYPLHSCDARVQQITFNSAEDVQWRYGGLAGDSTSDCVSSRTCFKDYCKVGRNAFVWMIDSEKEKKMVLEE